MDRRNSTERGNVRQRVAALLSGVLAGFCAMTAAQSLSSLSERVPVSLDLARLTWWSSLSPRLAQPEAQAEPRHFRTASIFDAYPAPVSLARPTPRPRLAARAARPALRKGSLHAARRPSPALAQDEALLTQAQARPALQIETQAQATAAPAVMAPALSEAARMRAVHGALRRGFLAALDTQSPMNTQSLAQAAPAEETAAPVTPPAARLVTEAPATRIRPLASRPRPARKAAIARVSRMPAALPIPAQAQAQAQAQAPAQGNPLPIAPAPQVVAARADYPVALAVVASSGPTQLPKNPPQNVVIQRGPAEPATLPSLVATQPGPAAEARAAWARAEGNLSEEVSILSGWNRSSDPGSPATASASTSTSTPALPQAGQTLAALSTLTIRPNLPLIPQAKSAAQGDATAETASASAGVDSQSSMDSQTQASSGSSASGDRLAAAAATGSACNSPQPDRALLGQDSFDPSVQFAIHSKDVTTELGDEATRSRWVRASAPGYWPTLEWRRSLTCSEAPVPMLSANSAILIATMTGSQVQSSAGVVFGRLPKGWSAVISGRADQVVVLDTDRNPSTMEATDRERYFAYLNVAPGTHLLYLSQPKASARGAVALPVVEGHATYIDVGPVGLRNFEGVLADASARQLRGVAKVRIQPVGQSVTATTDAEGRFKLSGVLAVGDHPVYLDTRSDRYYTHRYRALPARTGRLTLFHFGSATVDRWVNQLAGGVSPDAGLIIGAAPALVARSQNATLYPSVRPLSGAAHLAPEAYTLGSDERLLVQTPLEADSSRFVGVQAPEGANVIELIRKDQQTAWSEMVFSSPGVINVTDAN